MFIVSLDDKSLSKSLYHNALPYVHATGFMIHILALKCLEIVLKAIASLVLPSSWTSRAFGVAASLISLGGVVGSVVGTRLYATGFEVLWVSMALVALCGMLLLVVGRIYFASYISIEASFGGASAGGIGSEGGRYTKQMHAAATAKVKGSRST